MDEFNRWLEIAWKILKLPILKSEPSTTLSDHENAFVCYYIGLINFIPIFEIKFANSTFPRGKPKRKSVEMSENEENERKPPTSQEQEIENPGSSVQINQTEDKKMSTVGIEKDVISPLTKGRRTRIPDKPQMYLNIWGIVKNFIGQELSKVSLPINFNEPLSMLQRVAESFEYAELLHQAAEHDDPVEQLPYIAAFTISMLASSDLRTTKPFNPLLGETFEFDRTADLGWRLIGEQVSHHPPVSVIYCESELWKCLEEFGGSSVFSGNSMILNPEGKTQLEFIKSGHKYTWERVQTAVRNLILGSLYVEHYGETDIIHESEDVGGKCHLTFFSTGWSSYNFRRVEGEVIDRNNMVKWLIMGYWNSKIEVFKVLEELPWVKGRSYNSYYQAENAKTIWTRRMPDPGSKKYYYFSVYACQLNELEPRIAPTDSRYRPDQRLLELGLWEEARQEKGRLENNQRKLRSERGSSYVHTPAWYLIKIENDTKIYEYGGEYWQCKEKQDWSRCPDIF